MSELEPIESYLRTGEVLDPDSSLVVRGWPLTIAGLLRNTDAARRRYSFRGRALVAISAEVTLEGWDIDAILSGPRLRTRRSYAVVVANEVVAAGFDLLPTFSAPNYSVVMANYTEDQAQRLISVLGEVVPNPYHVRRQS
ncbi:MAG: hypothetical protein V3V01_07585 [Acidimicrobiales bacterium]